MEKKRKFTEDQLPTENTVQSNKKQRAAEEVLLHDIDTKQTILNYLCYLDDFRKKLPDDAFIGDSYASYQQAFKSEVQSFCKTLVKNWMHFDMYKMIGNETELFMNCILELYRGKFFHEKVRIFRYMRRKGLPPMDRDDIFHLFEYLKNDKNSAKGLVSILPRYETEIYPDTVQLEEFEIKEDKFYATCKMRGKNYRGFCLVYLRQLDIEARIVGHVVNDESEVRDENNFYFRIHGKLFRLSITWTTNVTGERFHIDHEEDWKKEAVIYPEDL